LRWKKSLDDNGLPTFLVGRVEVTKQHARSWDKVHLFFTLRAKTYVRY
jgi:hypothetical protein